MTDGWFVKFPKDVVLCEKLTGGDINILTREPFIEKTEKVNYSQLFSSPKKKESSTGGSSTRKRKGTGGTGKSPNKRPIVHPRFQGRASDHTVRNTLVTFFMDFLADMHVHVHFF